MPFKNGAILREFQELFLRDRDRVIPFVGSGLSTPLFPTWKGLLSELAELGLSKNVISYNRDELFLRIEEGKDLLEIAGILVERIGKTSYRDFMETHFQKAINEESIPTAYKSLFALGPKTIITTNYDLIPEHLGNGLYQIFDNRDAPEALRAMPDANIVFKLHGTISNHDSLVLTDSDYKRIIYANAENQNLLRTIFSSKTVVFLGFGLSDPHIDSVLQFLHSISSGIPMTHYALLPAKSNFEIDKLERRYGLKVIPYEPSNDGHPEVSEFIEMLRVGPGGPRLPVLATPEELRNKIRQVLHEVVGSHSFVVTYESERRCVFLSYRTRAVTELELQNEILSIAKSLKFETVIVDRFVLCVLDFTAPAEVVDPTLPLILAGSFSYKSIVDYVDGLSREAEFWSTVTFSRPIEVGTWFSETLPVSLPYIGGSND